MNKSNALSGVLLVAVVVLYILHFSSDKVEVLASEDVNQEDTSKTLNLDSTNIIALSDTGTSAIKTASSSKVAYFNLEDLVGKCSYLKLKTEGLIRKEERLYKSFASKEQEFKNWYAKKQQQLQEMDQKKILVQSHLEQAQMEGAKKQQDLQLQLQKEEKTLLEEKQRFLVERDEVIYNAVKKLNEKAGWDYVLVDNPEIRIVVPFNEKNNITDNLADIINKKHK